MLTACILFKALLLNSPFIVLRTPKTPSSSSADSKYFINIFTAFYIKMTDDRDMNQFIFIIKLSRTCLYTNTHIHTDNLYFAGHLSILNSILKCVWLH